MRADRKQAGPQSMCVVARYVCAPPPVDSQCWRAAPRAARRAQPAALRRAWPCAQRAELSWYIRVRRIRFASSCAAASDSVLTAALRFCVKRTPPPFPRAFSFVDHQASPRGAGRSLLATLQRAPHAHGHLCGHPVRDLLRIVLRHVADVGEPYVYDCLARTR